MIALVAGCSGTPAASASPHTLAAWAAVLQESVRDGNEAACRTLFSGSIAERVCHSLLSTDVAAFAAEADSSAADVVAITWRVGSAPIQQSVRVAWETVDGRQVVGSLTKLDGRQLPLWAVQSWASTAADGVTLLGDCVDGTLAREQAARAAVQSAALGELAEGWDGSVVVECPNSRSTFMAVTNTAFGDLSGIAAVAWPLGSGAATAVHIVLNPDVPTTGDDAALVLRHETVHVATRSYRWKTEWITEGLADAVAADSAYRASSDAAVRADVAANGVPQQLPSNAAFDAPAAQLNLTYGYARIAVETLRDKVGWDTARAVLSAWADGSTNTVDGVSQDQLLAWWQAALRG